MNDFSTFALIAQTTLLVIVSLLLVYPVVAYARNVAHTRGLLFLSGSFLVLTVTYVASFVLHMSVLSEVLDLTAALLAAAGTWQFAQSFVHTDDREVEPATVGETTGGFESAGDD